MKVNELMIGDWVKIKTYGISDKYEMTETYIYVKVVGIGSGLIIVELNNDIKEPYRIYENTKIVPIPLTSEILETNGFIYQKNSGAFIVYVEESYSNQTVEVTLFNVESKFRNIQLHICESNSSQETILHLMKCNYVHQLQHTLRLCGIEKEIIL